MYSATLVLAPGAVVLGSGGGIVGVGYTEVEVDTSVDGGSA